MRPTSATGTGLLGVLAIGLLAGLLGACDTGTQGTDAGMGDAGPPPRVDTDGDGLCDDTELRYSSDPLLADTDGDGIPDRAEVLMGYDPTLPAEPSRDRIVYLTEVPEGTATFPVQIAVRGSGESYVGAFDSLRFNDPLGRVAGDFYVGSAAVAANPPDNVFEVVSEAERFDEVDGRTLLLFEIYFAYGDDFPHRCARVYPFRYYLKRVEDGRYAAVQSAVLMVLPVGERADTAMWCPPEDFCL